MRSTILVFLFLFLETKQDESVREIVTEVLEKINERDDFVKVLNLTARTLEGWFTPGRNSTKVEFNTLTGSGRIIKSNLILDGYPRSEFGDKLIEETGLFKNQVAFVHEVLPELEKLEIEINDQSERYWIASFGIKDKIIILEDVVADKNYTRPDKNKGLDIKQSEIAIRTLAKYHAMTAVLAERNLIYLAHFNKSVFERNQNKIKNYYQLFFKYLAESIEETWDPQWNETAQLIKEKSENVTDEMLGIYERNDTSFNVLNNGGYTITNMLFLYGISDVFTSNDPIAMKMENSLNAFYNSPAFDLQMFINTSPNLDIMMTKKEDLVHLYYESLSKYLDKFDFKGRKPSYDEIQNEIKRTDYLGLIYAANGLCYTFLDPNEIVDLVNVVQKSWENNEVIIDPKCLYGKRYVESMKMILNKYFTNKN